MKARWSWTRPPIPSSYPPLSIPAPSRTRYQGAAVGSLPRGMAEANSMFCALVLPRLGSPSETWRPSILLFIAFSWKLGLAADACFPATRVSEWVSVWCDAPRWPLSCATVFVVVVVVVAGRSHLGLPAGLGQHQQPQRPAHGPADVQIRYGCKHTHTQNNGHTHTRTEGSVAIWISFILACFDLFLLFMIHVDWWLFVFFTSDRFVIIPLHSLMPTVNQTQVGLPPFHCLSLSISLSLSLLLSIIPFLFCST